MGYLSLVKIGCIVIPIIAVIAYIGVLKSEVHHYKSEADEVHKQFTDYKATQEAAYEALEQESKRITASHSRVLTDSFTSLQSQNKVISENIKLQKELAAIKLDPVVVGLFNDSANQASTPTAVEGNVGSTSPTETFDMQDLLQQVNTNNTNHWKCVQQVNEWQSFWSDYQGAVNATH